jgi:hypothetical protein
VNVPSCLIKADEPAFLPSGRRAGHGSRARWPEPTRRGAGNRAGAVRAGPAGPGGPDHPNRFLIRRPVPARDRVPRAEPGQVGLASPFYPLPDAVNRSFPAAVNTQRAIAIRQASG